MSFNISNVYDLSLLAANIGLVFSIFLLAYQIWLQRRETKFEIYEKMMQGFTDITLATVNNPELLDVYEWDKDYQGNEKLKERQKYAYLDSLFGLFERVWMAQKKMKWWESEWEPWENWIKMFSKSKIFLDVVREAHTLKTFDPEFIEYVERIIDNCDKGRV